MSIFDGFAKPPCAETLGWQLLEADEATGTIRVAFDGKPEFCNPGGNIQGGFVAAMLDDTLGPTVLVKTGGTHYCATINLNVSFLAPARPGNFTGVGRIAQLGKTVAFLEGELFDAAGQCVARATASARVVPTAGLSRP
ncbi:MAG: PaaI family thioesterase [Sphingomonadales bacterium]|nr:PaaI family thioesterase [Sphingomonadales bacterium]